MTGGKHRGSESDLQAVWDRVNVELQTKLLLVVLDADSHLLQHPLATLAVARSDQTEVGNAGNPPRLNQLGALGLHLAEGHLRLAVVVVPNGVDHDAHLLIPLEQSQCCSLDRPLGCRSHEDELRRTDFAEHTVDPWFVEWIDTSLVENDLLIASEHITRQIGAPVGPRS